ncbi:MAG: FmdB family transcriptional regulator [Ignavibacteria bacterium CG_4_9_14_3_um_filter_36_18]|nr:MAG: FmdB family transcriptional regulator [Ignavibacteria bacterium CG_4_9_14_3_um_filter_36_18]
MPTYDYKCLECNHRFELFQSMTAEPVKLCPKCSGKVKRLIGAGSGPIFKGTGFYQTDYKNPSSKNNSSVSKETKTDIKPETKTETKTEKTTEKKAV